MSIEIISHYLTRSLPVVAFTTSKRIYPYNAPQMTGLPYIVLNQASMNDGKHLDGEDEYPVSRIAVECLAETPTEAHSMGDAVRAALRNIIKQKFGDYEDIDVTSTETDMTDFNDANSVPRRVIHFRVRWRNGSTP
jgi:hypothetical protein